MLNKDLHKLEDRKKEAIISIFNNSKHFYVRESLAQKYLKAKGSEGQIPMNIFTI